MKSVKTIIAEALAAGQNTLSEYDSKRILSEYGIGIFSGGFYRRQTGSRSHRLSGGFKGLCCHSPT